MKKFLIFAVGIALLIPTKAKADTEIIPPPISAESVAVPDATPQVTLTDDGNVSLRLTPTLQQGNPTFAQKSTPIKAKKRRASSATLNDFLGTWIQRNTSAYSGDEATPTIKIYQEDGEIIVDNLYNLGNPVKATWDETDGTLSIKPQVLYQHATYGACTINTWTLEGTRVVYDTQTAIKVSLSDDGSLQFSQWGLFVSEGASAGAAFDAYYLSIAQKPNGTFHTISFDATPVDTTYSVLVYQPDESKVAIANMLGNSKPYYITLGANSSAYMLPQYVMSLSIYGDFYLYPAKSTGAIDKTTYITVTPNDDGTITIGPWGVYCMASTTIAASTGKTNTLTTDFKITYPSAGANPMAGSGTESDPWLVKSLTDLRYIALTTTESNTYAGNYFKLDNDINASASKDPYFVIGPTSSVAFKGNFDGNGKTIAYLNVDFGGNFYAGLFGNVTGDIKNLNLSNISFSGSGKYLGGVVGYTTGNVTECTVSGTIDATAQEIGGVIGYSKGGAVSDCSFSGTIYGGIDVGGIVGYTTGTITNCQSDANLYVQYTVPYTTISTHAMGGIAAAAYGTTSVPVTIDKCWFSGSVADLRGIDHIGGIVGYANATNVNECFNTGYIISRASTYSDGSSAAAGGISGYVSRGNYTNCFNAGTVSAPNTEFAGGLMGYGGGASTYEVAFSNCYTSGMINTKSEYEQVGVTGSYFSKAKLTIDNCYYDFQTTGLDTIAEGWKSTAELTSGTLPSGFDATIWSATAGLYPQLKSMEGLAIANLAVSPFFLSDNEIIGKIRKNFKVSTANSVKWGILQSNGTTVASTSSGVNITDGEATLNNVYASETLVAYIADGSYKSFTIRLVPNVFQGEGSAENPYLIRNKEELLTLQEAVNVHSQSHKGDFFKLTNDIDLKDETSFVGLAGEGSGTKTFAGTFDGDNHYIHNWDYQPATVVADNDSVVAAGSLNYAGFVGILNTTGEVKNLNIASDCSFSLYKYSAPVVGYSMGKVTNCKNYANVKAYGSYSGGIVGVSLDAEISGCLNAGDITAKNTMTAGIVGYSTGTVSNSFNLGNVYATGKDCSNNGGVVGGSYGTITYCGNNGEINGNTSVGGIVGGSAKDSSTLTGGNVVGCINSGIVTGSEASSCGAIIGYRPSYNEVANNYYDVQMNPNGGVGGGDGTGINGVSTKTLIGGSAVKDLAEYWTFETNKYPINTIFANDEVAKARLGIILQLADVDYINSIENQASLLGDNISWSLKNGQEFTIADNKLSINISDKETAEDTLTAQLSGYSKQYSLTGVKALFVGAGTEVDPHLISSIADMNNLANAVNVKGRGYAGHYFKLTDNLDYSGVEYTPVATDSTTFDGHFLGNDKTISNITYGGSTTEYKYIGLFRRVGSQGSISDLTLKSTAFSGSSYVGSFAGEFAGEMTNCVNEGTVTTAGNYAGGLAGYFTESATVTNSHNKGIVTATKGSYIGGLAGVFYGYAEKCSNTAAINGYTTYVGGLAGSLRGSLIECFNSADVTSTSGGNYVGGLVAVVEAGTTITNSYNTGNIIGAKAYAGGIYAGSITLTSSIRANSAFVTGCYNTGTITGSGANVGGIAGLIAPGHHISECYNTGEITSTGGNTVGGVVAETRGNADYTTTVDHCYNYGKVNNTGSAKSATGGVIGKHAANAEVTYCGNTGEVTSKGYMVGGVVGNQIGNIADCWNTGSITGANYAIAGISGYTGSSTSINRCFNAGDVKASEKSTKTYGTVTGICGYGYATITDCVNAGNLEGYLLMGGIAGTKFSTGMDIIRCYNTGKITIADGVTSVGNIFASAVEFTGPNYFNTDVNEAFSTDTYATGLSTNALMNLNIGENFVNPTASYPVPATLQNVVDVRFAAARYQLNSEDTETDVKNNFKVATCEGMTWTVSDPDLAQIQGEDVILSDATNKPLTLTLTYGDKSKSFDFTINKQSSGINDVTANSVVSRQYFDLRGIEIANPVAGDIYIVKTQYQDGTSTVTKERIK